MITKKDPNSPFWRAAAEAAQRVDAWPAWKRGDLGAPKAPPATEEVFLICDWKRRSVFPTAFPTRSAAEGELSKWATPSQYVVCRYERDEWDVPTTPDVGSGEHGAVRR